MVNNERQKGRKIKQEHVRVVLDDIAIIIAFSLTAGFVAAGFEFEDWATSKTLGFVMKVLKPNKSTSSEGENLIPFPFYL